MPFSTPVQRRLIGVCFQAVPQVFTRRT
ncbi:hypothetical protein GGP47_003352, partial [Salinibacter ruber]|nr:hypothetical protein [Salinibacter ruber]